VTDHMGKTAKVRFTSRTDYYPFRLKADSPVVRRAIEGVKSIGRDPVTRVTNGGVDANWMVGHGMPTGRVGAGQEQSNTRAGGGGRAGVFGGVSARGGAGDAQIALRQPPITSIVALAQVQRRSALLRILAIPGRLDLSLPDEARGHVMSLAEEVLNGTLHPDGT